MPAPHRAAVLRRRGRRLFAEGVLALAYLASVLTVMRSVRMCTSQFPVGLALRSRRNVTDLRPRLLDIPDDHAWLVEVIGGDFLLSMTWHRAG